jgi:DNA polymerase elongation subunit (family B)
MDNAKKYGYTFEIIKGYTFEKTIIFKEYVEFLYSLRSQYPKSNPLNLIAKILLNSLYGRFGMSEITIKYEIISKQQLLEISEDKILDLIEIGDYILIGLETESIEDNQNISICVAAAITAYARIHMTQFKNNPNIRLFYTDTDSIYTDSVLDPSFISSKILGKLKLEHKCKKAIFLSPKVYCLELEDGTIISKVKGLKTAKSLKFSDFQDLMVKGHKIKTNHIK